MRLALVLDEDRERVETLDNAAQLKSVYQVDRDGNTLPSDLGQIGILQASRHAGAFKAGAVFPLPALRCRKPANGASRARCGTTRFAAVRTCALLAQAAAEVRHTYTSPIRTPAPADIRRHLWPRHRGRCARPPPIIPPRAWRRCGARSVAATRRRPRSETPLRTVCVPSRASGAAPIASFVPARARLRARAESGTHRPRRASPLSADRAPQAIRAEMVHRVREPRAPVSRARPRRIALPARRRP